MTGIYEARIKNVSQEIELDIFYASENSAPKDDFVVSRDASGSPLSHFGDYVWDFSAYSQNTGKFFFYFNYWGSEDPNPLRISICREIRIAFFGLIWWRSGSPLAIRTLANYYIVLQRAAAYAESKNIGLKDVFGDHIYLRDFIDSRCSQWLTETLGSLLEIFAMMHPLQLGFGVVDKKVRKSVKARCKLYRASLNQHPPMPTRIYGYLIQSLNNLLSQWLCVSNEMLELARKCSSDPRFARTRDQQTFISRKLGISDERMPEFQDAASNSCMEYIVARGRAANVIGLSSVISEFQKIAQLIVQTFTGMREDEVRCLPYGCCEKYTIAGRVHYIVNGPTTKLNGGLPKRVKWVTNEQGYKALQAVQALADVIYGIYKVNPNLTQGNSNCYPLFVSTAFLGFTSKSRAKYFTPASSGLILFDKLQGEIAANIEEEDVRELENIDPHRAWRSEVNFTVNEPWKFTTHQLRRSLALYAQRSGLVSLPTLRRQLQHITEAMSQYYSKGSAYAKDFIGSDPRHFGFEWQSTKYESEGLSYIFNVLQSSEGLVGGHANWVRHRLKGDGRVILRDRVDTMRRFSKGEMAFRETLIGGCTNTGVCEKVGLRWMDVDCLRDNCKNLVCNTVKLQRVILAQEKMLEGLDKDSVEYRTELQDLEVLISAMEKFNLSVGKKDDLSY
jgi:hypothetical protein